MSKTDICSKKLEGTFVPMCVDLVDHIKCAAILHKCVDGRDVLVLI